MNKVKEIKSVGVFMGAEFGDEPIYSQIAKELGEYLADHQYRLVYGGGKDGLMGEVARSTMNKGGQVLGIAPKNLAEEAIGENEITQRIDVPDMNMRKQLMIDESDAFIALPGGFGTLEEISQVVSWAKIDLHSKPLALYNFNGFYNTLWAWFEEAAEKQFVPESDMKYIYNGKNIKDIFHYFKDFEMSNDLINGTKYV
jgi:uncharacterized protein (TIGR00730 family)